MPRDIIDTSEPTSGGVSRTYELFGVDEAEIRSMRIKFLVNEKWHDGLGKIIADAINEPVDDIARVFGVDELPDELHALLRSDEHSDVDVRVELFDGTDEDRNLRGLVIAKAGNVAVQSAVNAYDSLGVAVDEIMLALSGEDDNLFATGVIKENPAHNGGPRHRSNFRMGSS